MSIINIPGANSACFRKHADGRWLVEVSGLAPAWGDDVLVTKRNGDTVRVTIDEIVDRQPGKWLCSLRNAPASRAQRPAQEPPSARYARRTILPLDVFDSQQSEFWEDDDLDAALWLPEG